MNILNNLTRFLRSICLIATSAFLVVIMTGCDSEEPINWESCVNSFTEKQDEIKNNIPVTDHLVVYLDTSASMAGYVSPAGGDSFSVAPDGQTIFSKTLLELRSIVTILSPESSVIIRKVATDISEPSFSNLELSKAAINRETYNGKNTNLAGAIKTFNQPLTKDKESDEDKTDEEESKPPRFHILVTDGVQSSDNPNLDVSCDQGSDSTCVNRQISELLNDGWNATILGVRSEFKGNLYSEINNSVIPVTSGKKTEKFRPFYLYVFAPNKEDLERLTNILRRSLGEIADSDDSLHEFVLTGGYVKNFSKVDLVNSSKEFIGINNKNENKGELPRIEVNVDIETESDGMKPFQLKVTIPWEENTNLAGSSNELLQLIKWQLIPLNEAGESDIRYPKLELVEQEAKDGTAELSFKTGWTKDAGDMGRRMYRLVGKFDTDQSALSWVENWSTKVDTTADSANKTLNLEGSLGNLWTITDVKEEVMGGACISVGIR